MKRGKKLIALLVVLGLLVGSSVLIPKIFPEETETTTVAENTSTSILTLDAENVSALSWTYEDETMNFLYADGTWTNADDSVFPVDSLYLDTMITDLSDLIVTKTIDEPDDLADYGLDEPICSITVTEAATTEILIGDANAVGGSRYISIGDGKVYLAESTLLNDFSYTLFDLIEFEEIPSMYNLVDLIVTTADREYEVASKTSDDTTTWYHYEDGNQIVIDTDLAESFVDTIASMSWTSCLDYNVTEENLETYGLATPIMSVTATYENYSSEDTGEVDEDGNAIYETITTSDTFSLEIGQTVDGYCFARIPGSNMVYWIEESIFTTLADTAVEDLQAEEAE